MCEMVSMNLCGKTVSVSKLKVNKLVDYLRVFPQMKSVDKVFLFGSSISDRCSEDSDMDFLYIYNDRKMFHRDMSVVLPDIMPESCMDDAVRIPNDYPSSMLVGAAKKAIEEGVLVYVRP